MSTNLNSSRQSTVFVYGSLRKLGHRWGFHRPLHTRLITGSNTFAVYDGDEVVWSGWAENAADAKASAINLILTKKQQAGY